MPLVVRYIESQQVDQFPLLEAVSANRLQALGVQKLAEAIRQLGSLAKHAESIMGGIADLLVSYHERATVLEERTRRLREEVLPSLDPDREVMEGFEILLPSYHYKSKKRVDQQHLTQQNMPAALLEQCETMDRTPALHIFTRLWEDGRNALHYYSNPGFFFDHWRTNMTKAALRRRATVDLLSPSRGEAKPKANGSVKQGKAANSTDWSTGPDRKEIPPVGGSRDLKRSKSLSRSQRPRRHHGSTLSLQEPYGLPSRRASIRYRSFRGSFGLRSSFRRKNKQRSKQDLLTNATAAVYEGIEFKLSVPEVLTEEEDEPPPEKPVRRNSFLRRSFSFRRDRSRSRSRSRSPKPPIPTTSLFNGMQMHTVEAVKEKQETSKLATLSKHHLQNLELGTTDFETCLSLDASRKNSSTFKVPITIRDRSISPLNPQIARRAIPPPPSIATKARSSSDAPDISQLLQPPPKWQRFATVSGTSNVEVKKTAEMLKRLSTSEDRPASTPITSTEPFHHRQNSSQTSAPSASPPQLHHGIEPYLVIRKGDSLPRPKPKRPAPAKPPKGVRTSTVSTPPPPPVRNNSLNGSRMSSCSPLTPAEKESSHQSPIRISAEINPAAVYVAPRRIKPTQGQGTAPVSASTNGATEEPNAKQTPQSDAAQPPKLKPLVRKGSLYISPRKQQLLEQHLEVPTDADTSGFNKRASLILKAGGVDKSDLSDDRSGLLDAIRKGIQLNKVQKEEKEKETLNTMPWDVAAILERRIALLESGESDTDAENDAKVNEVPDEEWED